MSRKDQVGLNRLGVKIFATGSAGLAVSLARKYGDGNHAQLASNGEDGSVVQGAIHSQCERAVQFTSG